ncbi:MAG: hypothetical protein JW815_06430 [Candidatus Bathyarchaeota archaeon]|nr:hypothetical protein [Candidatus Bathyarchaeum sp.]
MKSFKKIKLSFTLATFLAFLLLQVFTAYSAEWSAPEEALTFLEDVVNLEMKDYTVVLDIYDVQHPSHFHGLAQENVVYTLESDGDKIQAAFAFVNKTFYHCSLFLLEGDPIYSQSNKNVLDAADDVLQRFQTYSRASGKVDARDFSEMRNALNAINKTDDVETKLGNTKLEVKTCGNDLTSLKWMSTLNGVDFPGITMEFQKGTFCTLGDNWRIYNVGSTDVTVSREEAIQIALDYVEDFSWTAGDEEVTDFNVVQEPLPIELITTRSREPLTLYPSWQIELYLDKIYPGLVNRIFLAIWADTGEVISCIPLSVDGQFQSDQNVANSSQLANNPASPIGAIISVAAATIIALSLAALVIKKKRH